MSKSRTTVFQTKMSLARQAKKVVGTWSSVDKKLQTEEARDYDTLLQENT
jgi:hypothetical protein